jgi:Tol biopolymer transport system component
MPAASAAQYFGANKIQYKAQNFRILSTEHFDVYFHLANRDAADLAAALAERWRERLTHFFNHELTGRQPLVMYNSHVDFEQTLIVDSLIDTGTRGFTEPWRRRIVLPFAGPLADTSHVIGHELVHAFQFDLMDSAPSMLYKEEARPLPLWLVEGLAEYLTIGPVDAHTAMWLRDAAIRDDLPHIDKLDRPDRFPYRWGHALLAYIGGRWGAPALGELYRVAMFEGVHAAVERALELNADQLSEQWHAAIREEYVSGLRNAAPVGEPLIRGRRVGGSTNVGPSLSPDGKWLAFLSERSFFSIDLFIADARTGEIARRLTDTAVDPHYSSLQFIDSAGAWDRDSRRLAVSAVMSGQAVIALFDWPDGKRRRDLVIRDVDEIAGLTWSPDGHAIAFAGLADGVTDLFIYDLERSALRRLTHDAFAELQPAWSPDGRRIAFVTDRFTTDVNALAFGDYRLALIDVDDADVERVEAFATAKHVNPQWSADGRSLYFVSDRDGISNLYQLDLDAGRVMRLTRSATGISGVSAFSPSVSVAAAANVAAAVVFTRGTFAIHTLPINRDAAIDPLATVSAQAVPDPAERPPTSTSTSPEAARAWPISRYKPRLSLEGLSQGSIGVGVNRFGAAVGSGLGVVFSDVLNTHRLVTAAQVNQNLGNGFSFADLAIYGAYVNRAHRWNWGVIGSSLPTLTAVRSVETLAESMTVPTVALIRQTERTGTVVASYGLNRARRVEISGGVGRLTYDRAAVSDDLGDWTTTAAPVAFTTLSAALVGDMTSYGATSVVRGQRYRFEVAPTIGTFRHLSVLADYRKYFMPVPFYTLAVRGLHFGRYGEGADDPRLAPLYLGNPALVRGYELDSLVMSECNVSSLEGCADIDRQLGSRLAVANVELRFPLLRPFGVSPRMYGPIPAEVAVFMDAGLVWRRGLTTAMAPGSAWSTGLTLRTNLGGLGLAQFNVARLLNGPRPGWGIQFNLVPAF